MNHRALTNLFERQKLPAPTLAAGPTAKALARALPSPPRALTGSAGLAHGWGGEDMVIDPPPADLFVWLNKGLREAKSLLVRMPPEALHSQAEFWRENVPRLVAFGESEAWVFWSVDGSLPPPRPGLATLTWVG